MNPFGDTSAQSGNPDEPTGEAADRAFAFNDRRKIDPDTFARRDVPAPGSSAEDPGNPENAGQPVTATVTADSADLARAKQEAAERTADLQRVSAEFANYRKRVDRDREAERINAKSSVLIEMLPVLDDLDRADSHGDLTGAFKTVSDKLIATLTRQGLVPVGAVGDTFDPAQHEAVQFSTSAEVSEPTVSSVLRHGYAMGDRLLRAAVVVVTGPEHDAAPEPAAPGDVDSGNPAS